MFGQDKKYLTIAINEGLIKIAQVSSCGKIEKLARESLKEGTSADDVAKVVKTLVASFNRKLPVLCLVPMSTATAKTIEVPSSDPEEIKSIINLQSSRHTPYSREEVLISHINLGLNASNNTSLLLVIVHRQQVKDRLAILEKAGLPVDKVLFAPEADARFYAKALNLKKDALLSGLIDFAVNATTFMVLSKGSLIFVRNIPIGIKEILSSPDASTKFLEEISKSMDAFMQENSGSSAPTSYTVTTSHEAVVQILPSITQKLGVEFKANPFINFIKASTDIRRKLQSDFADDSFLDVVAPAMSAHKCEINLMPEDLILKRTVDAQSREAIKTGVAVLVIMVLVGAMLMVNIYFKDAYLNKTLRETFAPERKEVKLLQEKMNKIKLVHGYIKGRMASLDVIHELYAITPNTIYLNNIAVDDQGLVIIDGVADSMSLVFSYVKSLDDSAMFKDAKTKSTATKKDNGKDVASFEIEFKLKNVKEKAA
ncbi:MAG: pilus assembly protein PilM [Candidatus Omnitrophica bacterium]|nr:pilus assembly protein PilM [Candidatus Omnitrophota bacterium]